MKARIKATGEVVDVEKWEHADSGSYIDVDRGKLYQEQELDFFEVATLAPPQEQYEAYCKTLINWEERTWDAALAIMSRMFSDYDHLKHKADGTAIDGVPINICKLAIICAKALVAEYRKGE